VTAEAIKDLHEEMCGAMVADDLAELDSILADGFTLTHMTGHSRLNLVTTANK